MSDDYTNSFLTGKPLERHFELQDALLEFSKLFSYEEPNDRAIVVIGASFLDTLLQHILLNFLPENEKEVEDLFNYNSLLGTYSSRLKMVYCLGLIDVVIKDDLKIIAKIRNAFAHNLKVSFNDNDITSWCKALKWHKIYMMQEPPENATTRDIFQVGVHTLISHLNGITSIARHEKRKIKKDF